jgi:hypothetical protein
MSRTGSAASVRLDQKMFPYGIPQWRISPLESTMMHPDDIRRLAIMATLIMLCVLSSGLARPVGG